MCMAMVSACKKSSVSFTPDCSGTAKSFSADVLPVISNKCAGCHTNYSAYSQIAGDRSSIRSKVADGSMPKGTSLTTTEKNTVLCWIDNGAPNN